MFWFKKQQKYIRLAHKQILLNYIFQVTSLTFYILNLLMSCHTIQFYNLFWSEVGFKVFSTSTSQIPTNKNAVQFSSVAQSCPTLCDPMDYSIPGLPVHHQLPEFTQTHLHWFGDTIQPSHPLSSPSPPAFNLSASGSFQMSQLFTSGGQSIRVSASTSVLPMNTEDWSPLRLDLH